MDAAAIPENQVPTVFVQCLGQGPKTPLEPLLWILGEAGVKAGHVLCALRFCIIYPMVT